MEEKPFKASLGSHGSDKSSPDNDIRNLWTRSTLSQPKLNVPRSSVGENSDMEGGGISLKSRRWYNQKAGRDSDGGWEERDDGEDKGSFKQEDLNESSLLELELRRASSLGSRLGEDVDSVTDTDILGAPPTGQASYKVLWPWHARSERHLWKMRKGSDVGPVLLMESLGWLRGGSYFLVYGFAVVEEKCLPQSHRSVSRSTHPIEPTGWSSRTGCHCL
ncbi:cation channel sperm-associated auxiliary subunit zeta isoform X1 [Callorhinus ursinus]|uniref:cation channel sperm-associated auxiliary subunit zeta isoform X1 n=1 Tax=Callorhinus ursinus TaxID=34884 RepID=UPI003CD0020D